MAHVPIPAAGAPNPRETCPGRSRRASGAAPRLSRLGQGRWRARVPRTRGGTGLDVYTCDDPPACLVVRMRGRVCDVLVEGELSGAAVLNLGDCLVGVVAAGLGLVVLRLGRRESVPLEAEGIMESFGRHLARGGLTCRLRLRGDGPGLDILLRAFERGCAAPGRVRTLAGTSKQQPATANQP